MLTSEHKNETDGPPVFSPTLSSPPASLRSSKSVFSQVQNTLTEMITRPKDVLHDLADSEIAHKLRTRDAFVSRLKTFCLTNWMGKPICLSPPLLSQYGWQCIGADTIKCCSCSSVLHVKLPSPCGERYREQCYVSRKRILEGHMKICSWPSYPCSDSLIAPFQNGVQDQMKMIDDFVRRRDNLLRLGSKLPKITQKVLKELSMSEADLNSIASLHPTEEGSQFDSQQINICSVLALCGWDFKDNDKMKAPRISCDFSGRSVRLHNVYNVCESVESSPEIIDVPNDVPDIQPASCDDPVSPKRSRNESTQIHDSQRSPLKVAKKFFHPLEQHYAWSHWVSVLKPISKDEFGNAKEDPSRHQYVVGPLVKNGKPGWQVLTEILLGHKAALSKSATSVCDDKCESEDVCEGKDVSHQVSKSPTKVKVTPEKAVSDFRRLMADITSRK